MDAQIPDPSQEAIDAFIARWDGAKGSARGKARDWMFIWIAKQGASMRT